MARLFKYNINDDFGFSSAVIKGERKYYVEGYASTIDRDKSGEIISASAQEDIYTQVMGESITLDVEHSEWYDDNGKVLPKPKNTSIPVAKVVDARLDNRGVWIKAELNQHLSKFGEIWGSIKDGFLKAFSIAFYPVQKADLGVIKRLSLVNITLTGSPVNPQATFSATMKSASAYLSSCDIDTSIPSTDALILQETNIKGGNMEKEKKHPEEDENKKDVPSDKDEDKKSSEEEDDEEKKKKKEDGEKPKMKSEEEVQAEIKAMTEKYEAEIKALKEAMTAKDTEMASLKAELAKPVMKATVTEVPKADFKVRSPLGLI